MPSTVGVDVGGTFTDIVAFDGETLVGGKVPTTPDQSVGVMNALAHLDIESTSLFLHGTTADTNALREERGARGALVTTEGFEDLIEIGRQARPSLYDPFVDRPRPLVPNQLRLGANGEAEEMLKELEALAPEAVAVALVRSYLDPRAELELASLIEDRLGVPVSTAARVSPGFREYERIATTVLNAYLSPEVTGYLQRLGDRLVTPSRLVMTSAGGLLPFERASELAGRLVLSGPAAGVVAAAELARAKGHSSAISFDMGGTSTDVCRITDGEALVGMGKRVAGRVNRVPSLPVNTIGAGGGSIVWLDEGGALRVGPRSAGAVPGPVAYGRGGTAPTVTDANVVLGFLPPDLALAGSVALDAAAAAAALTTLGREAGLDLDATALGVIEIVDSHMERAIRGVSVEEGSDPRESALVAFGGAGGLHAARLARRLGMRIVLIPPLSGVFSALGLLLARPRADATRTVFLEEGSERLARMIVEIRDQARSSFAELKAPGKGEAVVHGEVRYVGQSHELAVIADPDWSRLRSSFEQTHRSRFGFDRPGEPIELVDLRAEVTGTASISWGELPRLSADQAPEQMATTKEGRAIWHREHLPAGFEVAGPALIVERDSVILLDHSDRALVHDDGTLEITL
ncbi:MAG: hydantoinase/oxoprolinase family protein [Actinomycetota bacterium]|nr:hydantoinase/oxoprolinase family protein [Actinomycetota bacterium]